MTHTYIRPTGAGTEDITVRAIVHYANGTDATIRSLKLIMINDEYTTVSICTFKHELINLGKNSTRDITKREQIDLAIDEVRAITVVESIGSNAIKTTVLHIHPNTLVNVDIGLKSNKPVQETLSEVLESSMRDLKGFKRCVELLTADERNGNTNNNNTGNNNGSIDSKVWSAYSHEDMPEVNKDVVIDENIQYTINLYNKPSVNNILKSLAVKENESIAGASGNRFYTNRNK